LKPTDRHNGKAACLCCGAYARPNNHLRRVTRYQSQDTDPAGGDFTLVEDLDNAIQALFYNYTAQQIETGVPFDTDSLQFRDSTEDALATDPATGTVSIDVVASNWHDPIAATENLTLTFSNIGAGSKSLTLYLTDGDDMGPYTLTWPASVEWAGGTVVNEIPASGSVEVFLLSPDGGTTWRARRGGRNFA